MAIKYLRGIYGKDQVKTTRPVGFKFPVGLNFSSASAAANGASTTTTETFDVLVVAGGGVGGGPNHPFGHGGGGGAGGIRLLSSNSFTELTEYRNPSFISGTSNFIPVVVGGSATNSCFGSSFITCRGGAGGRGGYVADEDKPGAPGGSGGGGTKQGPVPGAPAQFNDGYCGGNGIIGQGCCGTPAAPGLACGGSGGAATCSLTAPNICNCNGLTTSITGVSVRYGDGGNGGPTPCNGIAGTANRGNGGNAGPSPPQVSGPGGLGGSGIVAVRYRNPVAPTTPIATGGDCICCTGGCIIHIFNSSGFLNVNTTFSIN